MLEDENDDVFNDEEPQAEVEAKAEAKEEPEKVEPEAKAEEEEPTASEDKDKIIAGLHKARDAERHKRIAAEAKLKKQEPVNVPDPVTDPDGYTEYQDTKAETKAFEDRINLTTDLMQDIHGDFTEKWDSFMALVSEDDGEGNLVLTDKALYEKLKAAPNPAKFAYNHVLERDDFLDKTSADYEKNLRASLKAELVAEMKDKGLDALNLPDLTNAQASASNTEALVDLDPEEGLFD